LLADAGNSNMENSMKTSLLRSLQFNELKRLEKDLFAELRSAGADHTVAIQRDIAWVQKCLQEKMEDVRRN
jgi:hypothetical protein